MESAEKQKPVDRKLTYEEQEDDQDLSVISEKNHQQRLSSSSSSSYYSEDDESDRTDKDDTLPAKQSPPRQVMERSTDEKDSKKNPNSCPYKIPSFVFARTNTTAPAEWSIASNESLFSIHTGNMSFTRDYFKSEDLAFSRNSNFSSPLLDFTGDQHPLSYSNSKNDGSNRKVTQAAVGGIRGNKEEEKDVQNVKEDITRESHEEINGGSSPTGEEEDHRSISHHSNGSSIQSFAFPILESTDKSGSMWANPHVKELKASQEQLEMLQPETPKIAEPQRKETKEVTEAQKIQTPTTNSTSSTNSSNSKWLFCFPCCLGF